MGARSETGLPRGVATDPPTRHEPGAADEKAAHRAHVAQLAQLFRSRPCEIIDWRELDALVGANYMQRISECRRTMKLNIECVPRYAEIDGRRKRITGDYRLRPEALGRDAADLSKAVEQDLFTDLAEWQR